MASESSPEIQVNVKGPSELKLQITIATDKTVLELKQAIADKSDVPADRQRLIYSGRVLKDDDLLSVYKIQSQHTIHMVKGASSAARSSAATSSSSSPSAASPSTTALPRMQTGQNVHDPLTQLNSHLGFGAMAGLNPFAEMGLNPGDPNMMQNLLNSPEFLRQMGAMMSNPAIMEQAIAMNPQLAAQAPQIRAMMSSPVFREMMSNPETLRMMMQMSSALGGPLGSGGLGNPFGAPPAFPAPGVPAGGVTPAPGGDASSTTPATPGTGAAAAAGGAAGAPPNPFLNPAFMEQMQQMMGGGAGFGAGTGAGGFGAGAGGMGGLFGAPQPQPPADTRSPEERFQVQLGQLNEMGFTNAQQNVRALLATAGNVHAAIEYMLGGGGLL